MKVKIGAGVTFDTVSPAELDEKISDLKSWHVELIKGGRPILFDAQAVIAGAAVTIGGSSSAPTSGRTGPEPGYVWAVRRMAQTGLANATDPTSIFVGDNEPSRLVFPNFTGTASATGYKAFNGGEFILLPSQKWLVASTAAIGSAGTVTISGAAWELPIGLLWQLV